MLINDIMPTIIGILLLMSRIEFVLSSVEYEKSFINSGPGKIQSTHLVYCQSLFSQSVDCVALG